jgi:hypothetical protein
MTDSHTGSYTATLRTDCASALKGTLQWSEDQGGVELLNATANYVLGDTYSGFEPVAGGTFSGTASGLLYACSNSGLIPTTLPSSEIQINAYMDPGVDPPWLFRILGSTAESGQCGGVGDLAGGGLVTPNCLVGPPGSSDWGGSYTDSEHSAISFNCSGSGSNGGSVTTDTLTGTLTATDPMPCGLWTTGCDISAPNGS